MFVQPTCIETGSSTTKTTTHRKSQKELSQAKEVNPALERVAGTWKLHIQPPPNLRP